jgi:hypothetical protein
MGIPGADDLLALTELEGEKVAPHGMSHFGIVVDELKMLGALSSNKV